MLPGMGYQYRDDEVARIVAACKGALGDDARARFTHGALEIGRGWRVARALWWLAAAVVIAAVLAFVGTMQVLFSEDRFLSALELAGWLAPAVLIAALGLVLARPRVAHINGTARTSRINGKRRPLADGTLVLARIVAAGSGFDRELSVRGGPSIIALEWVEASAAARMVTVHEVCARPPFRAARRAHRVPDRLRAFTPPGPAPIARPCR